MILHTVSSFFPGCVSKWLGIIPNIIFMLLTLVLLYWLCNEIFSNSTYGLLAMILYGLGIGAISAVMMVRMYMFKTLITIALAVVIVKLLKSESDRIKDYLCVMILIFCGLMTQYFFVFYAFFICVLTDLIYLKRKNYKSAIKFSTFAFAGAAVFSVFYFSCLNNVTNQNKAGSTVGNVFNVSSTVKVLKFVKKVIESFPLYTLFVIIVTALLILNFRKLKEGFKINETDVISTVVIVPALFSFTFISLAAVHMDLRYVYSLMPEFILIAIWLWNIFDRCVKKIEFSVYKMLLLVTCSVITTFIVNPKWVYAPNAGKYDELKGMHDAGCIYYTYSKNDPTYPSITQDCIRLINFEHTYFVDDLNDTRIKEYIEHDNKEKYVLYLMDMHNLENYQPDKMAEDFRNKYGFTTLRRMYRTDVSEVYELTK